jgi:uncharacterized protein
MTARYLDLVFSPSVKAVQDQMGSRTAYAKRAGTSAAADRLTDTEIDFIVTRDSFYMATVGSGGWPYLQHRGGPPGFVKVLDAGTLGLGDFRGNRQYVSVGNLADDGRASLFFMDYARRARLKILGRVRAVDLVEAPELAARLVNADYDARVERGLIVDVDAFDWNCPQHITPRFTLAELAPSIDALQARIGELEAQVQRLQPKT